MKKLSAKLLLLLIALIMAIGVIACSGGDKGKTDDKLNIEAVYAAAVDLGFTGTLDELIAAFKGDNAYQIAVSLGYDGSAEQWILSLKGASGKDGDNGLTPYINEDNGCWYVGETNTGVKARGDDGERGPQGPQGLEGDDGLSAYEIYKKYHDYDGTEEEWINDYVNGRLATYTVTFETFGVAEIAPLANLKRGDKITAPSVEVFTYKFLGWFKDRKNIIEWDFDHDTINADITLYALWERDYTECFTYSSVTSGYSVTGLTELGKTVSEFEIPSTYGGLPVLTIGERAFYQCPTLTSIIIPDSVTSIGVSAFNSCSGLTSIIIPDSVTSIGNYTFSSCHGLTSIIIPDSVTSIGDFAFENCSGLTSVIIPDSVTSIGNGAFYNCSGLTSVTIPDSITYIGGYAFQGCYGLTSITIPDRVISIGYQAFYKCTGLTSITIPDSVTFIGDSAFARCTGLTSITIPVSVTSISDFAFLNCTGLTSITIPVSVTSIGTHAFYNCTGLTTVFFGGDFDEWNAIDVDYENDDLLSATVYFYSEAAPVLGGNYWHYDTDGVTPIIWEA